MGVGKDKGIRDSTVSLFNYKLPARCELSLSAASPHSPFKFALTTSVTVHTSRWHCGVTLSRELTLFCCVHVMATPQV